MSGVSNISTGLSIPVTSPSFRSNSFFTVINFLLSQNELSAILRFGAEELFKEDKNDEENKKRMESMDIDEILERAEKVEQKEGDVEPGNELLSAFKARFGLMLLIILNCVLFVY